MWLHPWFFSMLTPHLGQGLVLAIIQVVFSLSLLFFSSHFLTMSQSHGLWASFAQAKQYSFPHLHAMSFEPPPV
jgi:ABC-type transport system involved in cytochrome bd biosynthesis fused ATPase/permease subunit